MTTGHTHATAFHTAYPCLIGGWTRLAAAVASKQMQAICGLRCSTARRFVRAALTRPDASFAPTRWTEQAIRYDTARR